ncbi:hypothetical protein [Streptomyces coeruleorubidus]|uniref:hypothetical protein n=1 Tax=Streptomyces coeruleorubidus TaxID=116188 RepID=UPI001876D4E1|nr:hypothetical protein [Streptomyces bellus]GGU47045.1 hypothetical protein GCM10010244_85880 [Streptomyces bellus]
MTFSRWSRRRTRRALRRGLSLFEVRLPSKVPGIGFTARITATVLTDPPYPQSADELAAAIRANLRRAASDIAYGCDPADVATARDVCGRHLARRRSLATEPPVEYEAELTLDLLPDDQAAVRSLLSAQRRQAVTDILRRQTTEAMAQEMAHPAALLVRWIEQQPDHWNSLPDPETVDRIAAAFTQYRPEQERTVEHTALEVIREFLDSFQDPPQKRMVYEVLAAGMRHAKRPEHAARAEALLNGHPHNDAAGGEA